MQGLLEVPHLARQFVTKVSSVHCMAIVVVPVIAVPVVSAVGRTPAADIAFDVVKQLVDFVQVAGDVIDIVTTPMGAFVNEIVNVLRIGYRPVWHESAR